MGKVALFLIVDRREMSDKPNVTVIYQEPKKEEPKLSVLLWEIVVGVPLFALLVHWLMKLFGGGR